jgi:hypothetical protein
MSYKNDQRYCYCYAYLKKKKGDTNFYKKIKIYSKQINDLGLEFKVYYNVQCKFSSIYWWGAFLTHLKNR